MPLARRLFRVGLLVAGLGGCSKGAGLPTDLGPSGLGGVDPSLLVSQLNAEAARVGGANGQSPDAVALRAGAQALSAGALAGSAVVNGATYHLVVLRTQDATRHRTATIIVGVSDRGDYIWGASTLPDTTGRMARLGAPGDPGVDGTGGVSSSTNGAYWVATAGAMQAVETGEWTMPCDAAYAASVPGVGCTLAVFRGTLQMTSTSGRLGTTGPGPVVNLVVNRMGGAYLTAR